MERKRKENSMSTAKRHMIRSHKTQSTPIFKSKDKAQHELFMMKPIFKTHKKKYDGKGNRIDEGGQI